MLHSAPTRTEKLCWSETVCNKTRDLLTRIDWKFYVLERLWSWHVLVIDNDYDHGICWRSIVSMIMTCVGDQEWLWSWHVLAIKLIRTDDWLLRHQNRWLITEASKPMIDYWGIKTDDWLLRHQNRWLITEAQLLLYRKK